MSCTGTPDAYAATAGVYDLFDHAARPARTSAMAELLAVVRPEEGPVLDVGSGSGLDLMAILEGVPGATVFGIEPSPAMRGLALAKIAERPEWFERVTLWPDDFFSAPLPERISGAVLLGVLGRFDAQERAAVLAEIAARLPTGGCALIDLQAPTRPQRVEAFERTAARVGALTYRCIGEAWPVDEERMRWRMTYLTLEGERVLIEDTAEHLSHHPAPERVAIDAAAVGLGLRRLGDTTFWMLTR